MNIIKSNIKTMSSREIAIMTDKQHSKVMRTIEDLINRGVAKMATLSPYINKQNNQSYNEYLLDKRDSLVLVARLSPEFTAAVIDRWQELESNQAPKPMSQLEMIAGMAGAMVEVERKQIEQQKALEDITGKVARLEASDKILSSCPVNAEGITAICARMNLKYSIPA